MKHLLVFFFLFFSVGCDKPEPEPEKKDPIYQDLLSELSLAEKNIAEMEKQLAEHRTTLEKVVPQTGQIRFAQKRLFETEKTLELFKQQKKYWTLRAESRRDYIRKASYEAFIKKSKLDTSAEYQEYLAEKRLRRARLEWDAKQRRQDFLKAEGIKEPKPAPKPGS